MPRGTPTAFPSLARESLVLRPEGRVNLTVATAGGATHRLAVRRPDPSALLAGAPTRISRSNRVGPSGQLSTVASHEVAVKVTVPLVRRICPASSRLNYLNGISDYEPSLGPSASGCHRFAAPPQEPWRACLRPGPGCAAPSSQPPTPARCCSTGTYSNAPSPDGLSRHASRVIAAGTARWSHPLPAVPSACPS